jgi:putative transposase
LKETQVVIEQWRVQYNEVRPHSSLGYRTPAPKAILPKQPGHGKRYAFPTLQTPEGGYGQTSNEALTIYLLQNTGQLTTMRRCFRQSHPIV